MSEFEQEVLQDAASYYVSRLLSNNTIQLAPGSTKEQADSVIYQTMMADPEARMDIVVMFWEEKMGVPIGKSASIH